jgi:hypothetical protein
MKYVLLTEVTLRGRAGVDESRRFKNVQASRHDRILSKNPEFII